MISFHDLQLLKLSNIAKCSLLMKIKHIVLAISFRYFNMPIFTIAILFIPYVLLSISLESINLNLSSILLNKTVYTFSLYRFGSKLSIKSNLSSVQEINSLNKSLNCFSGYLNTETSFLLFILVK